MCFGFHAKHFTKVKMKFPCKTIRKIIIKLMNWMSTSLEPLLSLFATKYNWVNPKKTLNIYAPDLVKDFRSFCLSTFHSCLHGNNNRLCLVICTMFSWFFSSTWKNKYTCCLGGADLWSSNCVSLSQMSFTTVWAYWFYIVTK